MPRRAKRKYTRKPSPATSEEVKQLDREFYDKVTEPIKIPTLNNKDKLATFSTFDPHKKLTTAEVMAIEKKRIDDIQAAVSAIPYTQSDLMSCLNEIFDFQEKSLLHFIFLGEVAKALKANGSIPFVDKFELAIPYSSITSEVKSLFESTWKFTKTDYGYMYNYSIPLKWTTLIPVHIYIYKGKNKLFDSPDTVFAGGDMAYVPNPMKDYLVAQKLIHDRLNKGEPLKEFAFI